MAFEKVPGVGPEDYHRVEYGRGLGPHGALDFEVNDFDWSRDKAIPRRTEAATHIAKDIQPVMHSQMPATVLS